MHIAMWSGPRNLSTALMYSFGARPDFDVIDEPFYGAYLQATGADHPMRDAVMASMECDPHKVAAAFVPQSPHLYSKQMTHHMLDDFPTDWFTDARHVFLIRHPVRVIASYAVKRERPTLADLGFVQQLKIFEHVVSLGQDPIVVDSRDILHSPEITLKALCANLNLAWDERMLCWPPGGHQSDGIWASHWYGSVHQSTGFSAKEESLPELNTSQRKLVDAALPIYETLSRSKLRAVF